MQYNIKNIKTDCLKFIEKINEKNPYYLVMGTLILVLIFDYLFIMQFQIGALQKIGPRAIEIKSDIQRFETNKDRIDKYRDDIDILDIKLASLQSRINTTEQIPVVLESLSTIANRNKVFIEQILPETNLGDPILENNEGRYFLLPVLVDAKSTYHNLGKFLNELEVQGPLMRLDSMNIMANGENPRQHLVKLKILAVIFEPESKAKK